MNQSDNVKFSIVIPTYNRANLLRIAIESVVNQTFTSWELIIVDNFSDDNTDGVIESFQDSRIKLLKIPRTGSVAASRNLGVSHASGEWIAFLDSDDWWFSNKLSVVSSLLHSKTDLIYHDLQLVNADGIFFKDKRTKSRKLKNPIYLDLLLNGNDIPQSSVVIRKSILTKIGGIDESPHLFAVEDYDTWLRASKITHQFVYIPEVLGAYRIHDGNIGKINNFEYLSKAFSHHLENLTIPQLRKFQSLYIYQIARKKYKSEDFGGITKELLFVIKYGKFTFLMKSLIMLISVVLRRKIHFIKILPWK